MILILEIGLAIYGLIALFGGKLTISKTKVVVGAPARLLGALALTPLPLAFMVGFLYALSQPNADPEKFVEDNKMTIMIIEAVVVIGIAILVFGIGSAIAVDPSEVERRQRRNYDDEYEDDRDTGRRARRDRDEDEEDDRDRDRDAKRPWDR